MSIHRADQRVRDEKAPERRAKDQEEEGKGEGAQGEGKGQPEGELEPM